MSSTQHFPHLKSLFSQITHSSGLTFKSEENRHELALQAELPSKGSQLAIVSLTLSLNRLDSDGLFVKKFEVFHSIPNRNILGDPGDMTLGYRNKRLPFKNELPIKKSQPFLWKIHSPSNLETLLRDYVHMSQYCGFPPLFTALPPWFVLNKGSN